MSMARMIHIGDWIDRTESDVALRALTWAVDTYVLADMLPTALAWKWRRLEYLQRED